MTSTGISGKIKYKFYSAWATLVATTGENMLALYLILSALIGYLFGSISISVLVSKFAFHDDVRSHGSGNAGATNMARVYGAKGGLIVLLGDFLKAIVAATIVLLITEPAYDEIALMTTGIACVLGHAFPVFFKFKGGKGVTVGAAVALLIDWKALVFIVAVFIVVFAITRIVSISSILGATGLTVITLIMYTLNLCGVGYGYFANFTPERLVLAIVASIIVICLHKPNIERLVTGTEKKFSFKKKEKSGDAK